MNYLAHALLSPDDPHILMGNLWGDLLRPKDYPFLHQRILEGVKRHRAIDMYTDQHESVIEIIRLVRPYQGKYAPVVTDVLMDYILSSKWETFHPDPIEAFCLVRYKTVESLLPDLPERLHPRVRRMLGHEWLESCKNKERMTNTLQMLSRRASFENKIPEALIPYEMHQDIMDELFTVFFEDLRRHLTLQSEG